MLAITYLVASSLVGAFVSHSREIREAREKEMAFRLLPPSEMARLVTLSRAFDRERSVRNEDFLFFGNEDQPAVPAQFAAFGFRRLIVQPDRIIGLWYGMDENGPDVEVEVKADNPAIVRLVAGHWGETREVVFEEKALPAADAPVRPEAAGPDAGPKGKPATGLVGYRDYLGLLGEEYSGNVFVIQHDGRLLACMSRHQFGGEAVPSKAEDIDGPSILLDPTGVIKQQDVQILPLQGKNPPVQFMEFSAEFELRAGERLWIRRGSGAGWNNGTIGRLRDRGLKAARFLPRNGPGELVMDLEKPADVRGASGSPVIQVATGKPVGVLLAADNGEKASYVVFEPICLPPVKPLAQDVERREKVLSAAIVGDWIEDFGSKGKAYYTFAADGSYEATCHPPAQSRFPKTTFFGRWRIEGQTLVYETTKCSLPEILKENSVTRDRVLEATADSFIYEAKDGKIMVMRRAGHWR